MTETTAPAQPEQLVCPKCHSDALRSDEKAVIGYPVTLTRVAGQIEVNYTGDSYQVFDEGTVYSGDLWCRDCGANFAPHQLIVEPAEEDEES